MLNFLKLYYQGNQHYPLAEIVDEYFSIFPRRREKHTAHLFNLQEMKLENNYPEWTEDHREAIRAFLEDFESQFREYFEDATSLFLMRHAETEENGEGMFLGQDSDPEVAGDVNIPEKIMDIQQVYTSPLQRSLQTARAVQERFNLSTVTLDDRLLEIDYGEADGMTYDELEREYPQIIKKWENQEDPRFPGGENIQDVLDRLNEFLEDLDDTDSVVVTHNVVLRCLLGAQYDLPMWKWHKIVIPHTEPIELLLAENGNRYINLTEEQVETCFQNVEFRDTV
jgi:broad specificity phosphatase PhoE